MALSANKETTQSVSANQNTVWNNKFEIPPEFTCKQRCILCMSCPQGRTTDTRYKSCWYKCVKFWPEICQSKKQIPKLRNRLSNRILISKVYQTGIFRSKPISIHFHGPFKTEPLNSYCW